MTSARRIFVGDIQGCRVELEELLEKLGYDARHDRLAPVGDLVNRGPDNVGCLRLLRDLGAECVLGNHDLHLLRCAAGLRELGAGDTIQDVLAAPDREELLAWLAQQPLLRTHPDLFQVHAGLHPRWIDPQAELCGIDPLIPDPRSDFCTRVRLCNSTGERPTRGATAEFEPWDRFYSPAAHAGRRVVFGHWAERGLELTPKSVALDSGCVWGGRLSAWSPEDDAVVSVASRQPKQFD